MLTTSTFLNTHSLRDTITDAYRMDESTCLSDLIKEATLPPESLAKIDKNAKEIVESVRTYLKSQRKIDAILHQYDLSTEEGIALMCLAEGLLRIPDNVTVDKFISDKISTVSWQSHLKSEQNFFVNAATWSLYLTGKIYAPTLNDEKNFASAIKRTVSRVGVSMIRPIIFQMMKALGKQFVIGQDIDEALKNAQKLEQKGYLFSYDMLGEAARTEADAKFYFDAYVNAIHAIGQQAKFEHPVQNPGISVKLSALSPRYDYTQYERMMEEIPPLLLELAKLAKQYQLGLTVDAEEADKLDLSLDIFEKVFADPALAGWEGLGLALQAYQKRAYHVIPWLIELAKKHNKRIMVRLVKGAYWDTEIKITQVQGLNNYPVFTRKNATDVSYIACARKMLKASRYLFSQFGTHNAYTVAAILEMVNDDSPFEFQGLYGMGRPLYDQIIDPAKYGYPCRIYAPVGTHKDLLAYLVRRLLENGANSSFINQLADDNIPIEKIVYDPVARMRALPSKPHPRIPLPKNLYGDWQNSEGLDLSNRKVLMTLKKQMESFDRSDWVAGSIINGETLTSTPPKAILSPSNHNATIGYVHEANDQQVAEALRVAQAATNEWAMTKVAERASILEKAADLLQADMPKFLTLLTREGGRSVLDSMSEIREAIDYCRYYAYRARCDMPAQLLPGPTGETNQLSLSPRGVVTCISPWNFPLAIFLGQVVAALAAGNTVIAKPAEQTPLIAYHAIQLLLNAGIPKSVLQLLLGEGSVIGAKVIADPNTAAVMLTGSTQTAKIIEQSLANRAGPIAAFIAETGGQNAMIVDSSALPEQVVLDIVQSSFNSAGQRCSALRVLFVQEEIAPKILDMLKGYMHELNIGDPALLATDIGPVIDAEAKAMLDQHVVKMSKEGKLIAQVPQAATLSPGTYFAPCAFEIPNLNLLTGEVFGPILHVIRYQASALDKVMDAIINTGYGLTLGIHSRIDATIQHIAKRMPIGNIYINRNMIGAVVGVQPFGGERLSGTGPKAGGPHYLPRLCVERTISTNITAVGGNARLISLLEED